MDIGKRITELRDHAGLSQSALARDVGTSQSAISQIESGERNPGFDMLKQIAKALGITVPYLVGAEVSELSAEEKALYRNYRGLTDEARKELEEFAAYLRHKQSLKKGPAKG